MIVYVNNKEKWERVDCDEPTLDTPITTIENDDDFIISIVNTFKMKGCSIVIYIDKLTTIEEVVEDILQNLEFKPIVLNKDEKLQPGYFTYLGNATAWYGFDIKWSKSKTIHIRDLNKVTNLTDKDTEKLIEKFDLGNNSYTLSIVNFLYNLNKITCEEKNVKYLTKNPISLSQYVDSVFKKTVNRKNSDLFINSMTTIEGVDIDSTIRESYNGGFIWYKYYQPYDTHAHGYVLDVNAMYTYSMLKEMPCGGMGYCKGMPDDITKAYFYIYYRVKVDIEIKEIPFLRVKRNDVETKDGLLLDTHGKKIELVLNQSDFDLMYANYTIKSIEYIDYIYFDKREDKQLKKYCYHFNNLKTNSVGIDRELYKYFENIIYGNWAKSIEYTTTIIKDDYTHDYKLCKRKYSTIQIGSAISGYARKYLYDLFNAYKSMWLYSDTDCAHLITETIPDDLQGIIGTEMGQLKVEAEFQRAAYFGKKKYILQLMNGSFKVCCAGLPYLGRKLFVKLLELYMTDETEYADIDFKLLLKEFNIAKQEDIEMVVKLKNQIKKAYVENDWALLSGCQIPGISTRRIEDSIFFEQYIEYFTL